MEQLMDCNLVIIHLKTTKKNERMDVCRGYFEMIENGVFIIDNLFETIYYFPELFPNHEIQACMQKNSCTIFSSIQKCICSLNHQNWNIILVDYKHAYVIEKTDRLVQILQDLSKKYRKVFDFEYDAIKNHMQEKTISENGKEDVSFKHTEKFESMVDCGNAKFESMVDCGNAKSESMVYCGNAKCESMVDCGNAKCESHERKNSMQMRRRVLKPWRKMKEELHNEKYFPHLAGDVELLSMPIFRIHATLMAVVNSNIDPYTLCGADSSLGEIVYDRAGPDSVVPHTQPAYQTNTRNVAVPNATVSNDNPTQTRQLEESSNSESFPSSIHGAHEQYRNQQNCISSGKISEREHFSNSMNNVEATGGTSVPVFTASDHIRSPQYQAYHVRLSTFTRWPSNMTQKPEQIAQAGFYYTGLQDVVRCFACDGGLKNWDPEDDPWIEQARWFPQCPFVQKVKGQEFVNLVRRMAEESDEEEDAVVHSTFQRNNPMADSPALKQLNLGNDADEPSQLETGAAKIVIQTGYSKSTVAIAVDEIISKGKRKYTAQDIIEIILEKEDIGERLPKDGRSELPRIPSQSIKSSQSTTEERTREKYLDKFGRTDLLANKTAKEYGSE
ncbi:hypothetical protein CHS0354_039295 [Potamilus streckersoni]|uniref:Uncharacterized protein n=1 Tax=Potamilus streckersoni TaxID=2493646 RepID=A0AAE0VFA1_9BIVA|nr:hypothetical protein CHS0354_039295 [Potamilus streckersoni]